MRPRIQTNDVDTGTIQSTIDLSSDINADDIDRDSEISVVSGMGLDSPAMKEQMKELAFMEDIVEFTVGSDTNPFAIDPIPVGVNGVQKAFKRGQVYREARKFLNNLIIKQDNIKTVNYKDDNNVDQTKIDKTSSLVYPVSIINDPSPNGRRWFIHKCTFG